jgi:hypothetical protein
LETVCERFPARFVRFVGGVRTTANRGVSTVVRSDCVRRKSVTEPIPPGFAGATMTVTGALILLPLPSKAE